MKIFIACDHRGIAYKTELKNYLEGNGIIVNEVEVKNHDDDDYPDFAYAVSKEVLANDGSLGILICGNGVGMSIAANKVKGIRAVRAVNVDDASKAKNHNGANVICLGSDMDIELLKSIVDTFITTKVPSEERHLRRINKIISYENGAYNEL